jgi:hypothetical protein
MSDDAFYSPTYRPPPPRQPRPLEHVWSLWKNGHRKDCGLYFHGSVQLNRTVSMLHDQICEVLAVSAGRRSLSPRRPAHIIQRPSSQRSKDSSRIKGTARFS